MVFGVIKIIKKLGGLIISFNIEVTTKSHKYRKCLI